jgi:CheY-like chemotaxis protein
VLIELTGWDESEARERALEAGFDHYVVKPITAAALSSVFEPSTA